MFYMFVTVAYVWSHATGAANRPQKQVLRGLIKSAERPTTGPRSPTVHTVFVWLDISLVQSFEFSLDNSDARYTGYYRRGQRIRFCMIAYRLFYSCTVKGFYPLIADVHALSVVIKALCYFWRPNFKLYL